MTLKKSWCQYQPMLRDTGSNFNTMSSPTDEAGEPDQGYDRFASPHGTGADAKIDQTGFYLGQKRCQLLGYMLIKSSS